MFFLLVLGCVDCGGFRVEVVVFLWFVDCGLVFFVFDFFFVVEFGVSRENF